MMNEFTTGYEEVANREVDTKIEQGKHYFLKGITKSGHNNYQNFQYLELYDILPIVRQLCKDLNLRTRVEYSQTEAVLVITDNESMSSAYFTCDTPLITDTDPNKYMQNRGKVRTYAMRYLYIQAFEIAVPDEIDKNSKPEKTNIKKTSKQKPQQNVDTTKKNNPKKTETITGQRDIHDLARTIAEEMNSQGIPDTTENSLQFIKEKWQHRQLSPNEYRQLKAKLEV